MQKKQEDYLEKEKEEAHSRSSRRLAGCVILVTGLAELATAFIYTITVH